MSLQANALVSLEELKSFMGIDISNTSKDATYEIYINATSKAIENIVGRFILAKDYKEKYAGTNSNELILKHYPINDITSIKFICDSEEYEELDSYDYDVEEEEGIIYRDLGWRLEGYSSFMSRKIDYPRRHIKVEYNGGFIEAPADLKLVCLQYISDLFQFDNSKGGYLKDYAISDVKLSYKDDIKFSEDQLKTIKSYRSVHF